MEIWKQAKPTHRWLAAGLSAALVLAVGLGLYLNRPEWVVLVNNADPRDAAAVVAKLEQLKVPYRPIGDGYTITVPKSDVYTARLALAQAGLPRGGSVGLELFDEPKFGATEFDKRVNYLRAQQGELERALERIAEVEYANVKLAIPERSVFVRDQQPVTASVLIQTYPGYRLTPDQVTGIINFVSGSVEGLSPENVTVVDHTGRLLSNGGTGVVGPGEADALYLAQRTQLSREMERKLQALLEPVFGPGNVVAQVNVELNMDSTRIEKELVEGSVPRVTETVREAIRGAADTGGTAELPSGGVTPPTYAGQGGEELGDSWRTTTRTTYDVGQLRETTVIAPGSVERVSVAITINRQDLTQAERQAIKEIAAGATGAEMQDIAVLGMAFATAQTQVGGAAAAEGLDRQTLAIALGALALLLLLAGIWTLLRRRTIRTPEVALAGAGAVPAPGSRLDATLGLDEQIELPVAGEEEESGTAATAGEPAPPQPEAGAEQPLPAAAQALAEEATTVEQRPTVAKQQQTAQQMIETVIASRPSRQIVIGAPEIPQEMLEHIRDLAENFPEVSAETLKEWIKDAVSTDDKLAGRQKAALFCINVGPDLSAHILKHLSDEEIELLIVEVARAGKVTAETRDDVLQEFIEMTTAHRYIRSGGIDYAREILAKALGEERATEILKRLSTALRKRPFDSLRTYDPIQLASFLQNEHPQTVAVILAHLAPDQAAVILADMPPERQADIIRRVATLDPTMPEMLREAEGVLERKLSAASTKESSAAGGIPWVVDVLNRVDRSTERSIMGQLEEWDAELAQEISQRMFLFEDIVQLDDFTVQQILRRLDLTRDLPLALKAAKDEVWQKILSNVSKRNADAIREAVELLGPVRIRDVEEAQARIVATIRDMEARGEIQIVRGGAEDEFI